MNANLALVLLPVTTGLTSVAWSQLVRSSWGLGSLSNVVAYAVVVLAFSRVSAEALQPGVLWVWFALTVALNIVVSWCWVEALKGSSLAMIGFVEIGYPFFILLFSKLLLDEQKAFNFWHVTGGLAVALGTCCVVYGNIRRG